MRQGEMMNERITWGQIVLAIVAAGIAAVTGVAIGALLMGALL